MSKACRACFVRDNPPPRPDAAYLAAVADRELGLSHDLCPAHTRALAGMKQAGQALLDKGGAPLGGN